MQTVSLDENGRRFSSSGTRGTPALDQILYPHIRLLAISSLDAPWSLRVPSVIVPKAGFCFFFHLIAGASPKACSAPLGCPPNCVCLALPSEPFLFPHAHPFGLDSATTSAYRIYPYTQSIVLCSMSGLAACDCRLVADQNSSFFLHGNAGFEMGLNSLGTSYPGAFFSKKQEQRLDMQGRAGCKRPIGTTSPNNDILSG